MYGKTATSMAARKTLRMHIEKKLLQAAAMPADDLMRQYGSSPAGLSGEAAVLENRARFGDNRIGDGRDKSAGLRLAQAFVNPFTAILAVIGCISVFTDIILPPPGARDVMTVSVIAVMIFLSGLLRFIQEARSDRAAAGLAKMVSSTAAVIRQPDGMRERPITDIVAGDIIRLAAGDMVPADCRILRAKDLFISQSAMTGESEPVEKTERTEDIVPNQAITDCPALVFMGSTVVSGSATVMAVATGQNTLFGDMAAALSGRREKTGFEKGLHAVSGLLIRFMLIMVPVVFLINGLTKGDWMEALLFSISIAVGLTPEMLPMIVTTSLAKGAVVMSRKKTIIKNLGAIQNLGAMTVLCTDKTGTLTQDKVIIERHLDCHGQSDDRVLMLAFLNSFHQTGLKNLMDRSIIELAEEKAAKGFVWRHLVTGYAKIDEIPFDFERRRMSVVVASPDGHKTVITKGALEEMLSVCSHAEYDGRIVPLDATMENTIRKTVNALNDDGMRVIAVAWKTPSEGISSFSVADESDMIFAGYLAFLDPPRESTKQALAALASHGVGVRILTGDNERVTRAICRQVGMPVTAIMSGAELEAMDDAALARKIGQVQVFARLSPAQKARIVTALREQGEIVGYLGDGINDTLAMKASDVGISVDSAVDIARESADVVLLEKDLMVLEQGVVEGRRIYGNLIKYIKMTTSSNFGNMFSVLAASLFLPFLPMAAVQIILLNLIYDTVNIAMPWDRVDQTFLARPRRWDASSIGRFMVRIGPVSSVFDIVTFLLMYFIVCPAVAGGPFDTLDMAGQAVFIAVFHAGWFVESMWTQTLVMHVIRTEKGAFFRNLASWPVLLASTAGVVIASVIPMTSPGQAIGLARLPWSCYGWFILIAAAYMALVTLARRAYIRRYGEWL